MDTPHRVAIFDRASLGGAAASFAIIISLGSRDNDLDQSLCLSMALAFVALPLLLALYLGKDAMLTARGQRDLAARKVIDLAQWACIGGLACLAFSIAALGGHVFGRSAGIVIALWLCAILVAALKADMRLGHPK